MAHTLLRSCLGKLQVLPVRISQDFSSSWPRVAAICQIQAAGLRATMGEPYPYDKNPFPYEKKNMNFINEWFDNTVDRLNENSKMITVEGPIGIGKNDFAKRLAKNFDLKVINSVPDSVCFKIPHNNFDIRVLDDILPPSYRSYDLNKWLQEPNPEKGTVGKLQLMWYKHRCFAYARGLLHLMSTGQGVVVANSCFADRVKVDAMSKCGYVTPNFREYFVDFFENSICDFLKPHITIYLDAPVDVIMDRIRQRNNPLELNSKVINEDYIQAQKDMFESRFLDKMRKSGEVVEINWAEVGDDTDIEIIADELQHLYLDREHIEDERFEDWILTEDMYCQHRAQYANQAWLDGHFARPWAWKCPEVMPNFDERPEMMRVMDGHPAISYYPGWAPELGHSVAFKL